jgi:predicted DNA binding CopG/RHH family protein
MKKSIPRFKSEDEEQEFWATHDVTDYFDTTKVQKIEMPNLKPSTQTISLRLPLELLNKIKVEANRRDMPYQTLIKAKLYEEFHQKGE